MRRQWGRVGNAVSVKIQDSVCKALGLLLCLGLLGASSCEDKYSIQTHLDFSESRDCLQKSDDLRNSRPSTDALEDVVTLMEMRFFEMADTIEKFRAQGDEYFASHPDGLGELAQSLEPLEQKFQELADRKGFSSAGLALLYQTSVGFFRLQILLNSILFSERKEALRLQRTGAFGQTPGDVSKYFRARIDAVNAEIDAKAKIFFSAIEAGLRRTDLTEEERGLLGEIQNSARLRLTASAFIVKASGK